MKIRLTLIAALFAISGLAVAQDDEKRPERKPQAEIASTSAKFASIAATDGSVKDALKADDLDGAKAKQGKQGAFTGKIVKVFAPKSNAIVILNFHEDYKKAVTAIVEAKNFDKFPRLAELKGKTVLVTGKFDAFKGAPQIALKTPDQLKIVK
jgi:DNA/RNA endonuclease YhcR with UshA esterase domain